MRETTSTLQAAIDTDKSRVPIARLTLYKTPHGGDFLGPSIVVWKNSETDAGDPWIGERPAHPGADPFTNQKLLIPEKGQAAAFWGVGRPFGLSPSEPHTVRIEGYFSPLETQSVQFMIIGNGDPVEFDWDTPGVSPSAATNRIATAAADNTDQRQGSTYLTPTMTKGLFYPFSARVTIKPGGIGKLVLLWRPNGETNWRLVDAAVASPRAAAESSHELPATVISGEDEVDLASALTFTVPASDPLFTYASSLDAYGVLRPGFRVTAELGYRTSAGDEYLQMGEFYLAGAVKDQVEARNVIKASAKDALGKAADEPALIIPNVIDYDLAGYSSDSIWVEPEQRTRYTAFDSWTLAQTVRAILYTAGLSSKQLHAKDGAGNDLIQENDVRLDRSAIYRLRLPGLLKNPDLKYSLEPGQPLLPFLRKVVQTYGYQLGVNGSGDVFLRERDTGSLYACNDLSFAGTWAAIADTIDAFAGEQREATAAGAVASINAAAGVSKVRVFVRREPGSSATFDVDMGATNLAAAVAVDYDREWSYKDGIDPATGRNAAVFEYSGTGLASTVSVTCGIGVKIQGIELVIDDSEANPITIRGTRETISAEVSDRSLRNDVIVAGKDRGPDTNSNILARATDVGSIGQPAAGNYIGRRRLFILPDERITRDEVAKYLAHRVVREYTTLFDRAKINTPGRPELEHWDPMKIHDVETGIEQPGTRFLRKHNWSYADAKFTSQIVVDPYPPLESYRNPVSPSSPPGTLTDVEMRRTDGVSIDPDLFVDNELTETEYQNRQAGCFSPGWADETDAIHIEVSFKAWRPGYCTIEVRDLATHRVVAVLVEDEFLEFGEYSYLWSGRYYNASTDAYLYYPLDPQSTVEDWEEWQNLPDPIFSIDRGRAGWVYISVRLDPLDTTHAPEMKDAINADDTAKSVVHCILRDQATQVGAGLEGSQTVYGKRGAPDNVPHGGRFDIRLDQHVPGLPRGFKFTLGHNGEPVKYVIGGWIDTYIIVYESSGDWTDGARFYYLPQEWTAESLARGRHLWKLDGTVEVVQGETDFLAAGTYTFLFDPVGLALVPDPAVRDIAKSFQVEESTDLFGRNGYRLVEDPLFRNELPIRRFPYRPDYLAFAQSLFPGKIVGVGFHIGSKIQARNRSGDLLTQSLALYPHRLEDVATIGNKHGVWPPALVNEGELIAGNGARLRSDKPDGVGDSLSRIAHFTLSSGGTNLAYD